MFNPLSICNILSIIMRIIMLIFFSTVLFILTASVPTFKSAYESIGKELPVLTRLVLNASKIINDYFYIIIPAFIVAIIVFFRFFGFWSKKYQVRIFILVIILCVALITFFVYSLFLPMFSLSSAVG